MLRSTRILEDARIHAIDGDIGHLEEFYFDDRNWRINYAVINIGSKLHDHFVLTSPDVITSIKGDREPIINVALTKEQVRRSLDAQMHRPISSRQPHDYYLYLGWPDLTLAETPVEPDSGGMERKYYWQRNGSTGSVGRNRMLMLVSGENRLAMRRNFIRINR